MCCSGSVSEGSVQSGSDVVAPAEPEPELQLLESGDAAGNHPAGLLSLRAGRVQGNTLSHTHTHTHTHCIRPAVFSASHHVHAVVCQMACEKLLEIVAGLMPQNHEAVKSIEEQRKPRSKTRKGASIAHT